LLDDINNLVIENSVKKDVMGAAEEGDGSMNEV